MHPDVIEDVVTRIERLGGMVRCGPATDLLTVNDEFTASVVIARCGRTPAGARRKIRLDTSLRPDITVALRMNAENEQPLDYYLLPRIGIAAAKIRLAEGDGVFLDAYRFDSLDYFFRLASRISIRAAA